MHFTPHEELQIISTAFLRLPAWSTLQMEEFGFKSLRSKARQTFLGCFHHKTLFMAPAKKINEHNAFNAYIMTNVAQLKKQHIVCYVLVLLACFMCSFPDLFAKICRFCLFFKINLGWDGNERCTYLNCPFFCCHVCNNSSHCSWHN